MEEISSKDSQWKDDAGYSQGGLGRAATTSWESKVSKEDGRREGDSAMRRGPREGAGGNQLGERWAVKSSLPQQIGLVSALVHQRTELGSPVLSFSGDAVHFQLVPLLSASLYPCHTAETGFLLKSPVSQRA